MMYEEIMKKRIHLKRVALSSNILVRRSPVYCTTEINFEMGTHVCVCLPIQRNLVQRNCHDNSFLFEILFPTLALDMDRTLR